MAKAVDVNVRIKTIAAFGSTPTDVVVKGWLEKHGVDPNDVMAYRISRSGQDTIPIIELTMHYSEEAVTDDGVPS